MQKKNPFGGSGGLSGAIAGISKTPRGSANIAGAGTPKMPGGTAPKRVKTPTNWTKLREDQAETRFSNVRKAHRQTP